MISKIFKILAVLATIFVLFSCKCNEKSIAENAIKKAEIFDITYPKEIPWDTVFVATFKNASKDTVTIYSPVLKNIEKFEKENWRRVKIVYCPCGANCESFPRTKKIAPGEKHIIKWNVKESWCGEKMENGLPKFVEVPCKPGNYRFYINYSFENDSKTKISKEFKILGN